MTEPKSITSTDFIKALRASSHAAIFTEVGSTADGGYYNSYSPCAKQIFSIVISDDGLIIIDDYNEVFSDSDGSSEPTDIFYHGGGVFTYGPYKKEITLFSNFSF